MAKQLIVAYIALFVMGMHSASAQNDPKTNITGLWSGWHQCKDRKVATSAMISVDSASHLMGIREFYPSANDPDRASGSFRIHGTYNPATRAISLLAGEWINHPRGYGKCDFLGTVDTAGSVINGESPKCGCERFKLQRQ